MTALVDAENPGTVAVQTIWDEAIALLRGKREPRLNADAKILLTSLTFADDEGVAVIKRGQLAKYCAEPSRGMATVAFLQRRIDHLIGPGVLASSSTPLELRSMWSRTADEAEQVAA